MNTLPEIHLTDITTMTVALSDGNKEGDVLVVKLTEDASMMFIWDGDRWVKLAIPAS